MLNLLSARRAIIRCSPNPPVPVPAPIVPDRPRHTAPAAPKLLRAGGFTLVEVMMAALILVVAFMGMIQAVTIGSELQATARRQTLAGQIINHEFEKLRFKSWTQIQNLTPNAVIDSQFSAAVAASGATFALSGTVVDVTTNLREVTFTVTWTVQPSGLSVSRTYTRINTAYFTKNGLSLTYQRS